VSPGKANSLRLTELDIPKAEKGQVLLKVLRVGICGTDRDIIEGFYGDAPHGYDYLVIGHESLCRIEEADNEFKRGDLVVPTVRRGCPENCEACRIGMSDMCLTGNYKEHGIKGLHGFGAEYALTDSNYLVKLPESLTDIGVLLEPLTIAEKGIKTAFNMQKSRFPVKPKMALVLGAGPVGLLATALLRLYDIDVDTVATRPDYSLKANLVRQTGATYINSKENPLSSLEGKYDLVFELTGNVEVAMEAQKLARANGIVSFLGIYRHTLESEDIGKIFTDLVLGNRVYFGSVNANRHYFEDGVNHLLGMQERWPSFLNRMITRTFKPEDYSAAYFNKDEEEIKTVISFTEST